MNEKEATKLLIEKLKEGYGANCETSDLDDFEDLTSDKLSELVVSKSRCASCRAKETILFLEHHLELLEDD